MESKGIIAETAAGRAARDGGSAAVPAGRLALLKELGPGRIVALGAVALLLLGFFAFVVGRATEPAYTLLYSGLELRDAQQLSQRLDAMGVAYRLSADGGAILVPAGDALRLRMSLAEEGLPVGNTVGYELFDRASPFTTSDFLGNVNLRRATEGELARTIGTLRQVRSARVHVVEPKRSLFGREEVHPTASIVLALRQPGALAREQIAAIRHLVAAAVPGLEPQAVTIVDDRGNLLAEPSGEATDGLAVDATEERRVAFEDRLRGKIVQLLERTLGQGRVDAAVSADLDFDEVATTAELYDPNTQVVRSTRTADETSDAKETKPEDAVSVANNLPTEKTAATQAGPGSSERKNRTEETVNYEISRTVRNQTKRGSTVRRLSIAVQVDGNYRDQPDGSRRFEPRSAEELAQIKELVRSATGADEGRGDVVEVVSRPFLAPADETAAEESWAGLAGEDYRRLIELAVLGVLTLLVLFVGVRPLLARLFPATPRADGPGGVPALEAEPRLLLAASADEEKLGQAPLGIRGGEPAGLLADGSAALSAFAALPSAAGGETSGAAAGRGILDEIAGAIDTAPEDAVRVIRGWLNEG
jgi:flagellar M-ring protein FliF